MAIENAGRHQNPYAWNPVYWLTFLALRIPLVALNLVLLIVSSLFNKLQRTAEPEEVTTVIQTDEKSEVREAVQECAGPAQSEQFWEEVALDTSEIRLIELPKGHITFRYDKDKGVAKGKFTATQKTLRRSGLDAVDLTVHCPTLREANAALIARAEAVIASAKTGKRPRKAIGDSTTETLDAPPGEIEVPPWIREEDAAMGLERDSSDPFQHFTPEPQTLEAPVESPPMLPRKSRRPECTQISYKGTLAAFGMENRRLDDPKKGEKTVRHFCVRIFDETLQAEHPLWGNDLKRVIEESGAQIGDRVEVGLIGESEILIKGKPTKKKIWSLIKL